VGQNVPRDKWWIEQAIVGKNKKRPGTLSSLETPEQPSPELLKATLPAVRSVCELNSCAMPMARAGHGTEEGCGYRAGRDFFVPYGLNATRRAADSTVFRRSRDYRRNRSAGITVDPYWSGSLHSPQGVV
jgi:hypothetical protein